jgi:aminoglycoside N3'-acetyltransferase
MAHDNGVHFRVVGRQFVEARKTPAGRVGDAESLLFSTRDLVDFSAAFFLRALPPS